MPAGDRYVEVPAMALFGFLESKGFVRSPVGKRSFREVVYELPHKKDHHYRVLVYTSVAAGNAQARKCGADAIRVVALWEEFPDRNVRPGRTEARKFKRVFRTGTVQGVLDRTLERMRGAYALCNQALKSAGRL